MTEADHDRRPLVEFARGKQYLYESSVYWVLLIVLVLLLARALPTWSHSREWG
jgi:hypothetical protein